MRKRNKKSRRNRQQGNQACGRKAFKVEQLEARRMMCGDGVLPVNVRDIQNYTADECWENEECAETVYWKLYDDVTDATATAWKALKDAGVEFSDPNYVKWFNLIKKMEEENQNSLDAENAPVIAKRDGSNAKDDTVGMAKAVAEEMSGDSEGWHTGFLGLPYYNLETTTPDGDNEGGITWAWEDGDGESGHGAIDEDDKLIWAWDDEEESEGSDGDDGNGEGQKDDKSKGDEASDDDSSRDEDDDDGITWFWEDDDEDDDDEDEGDSQSRQTEESRDSDPRRGGNGPDPRQGGLGRPGAGNNTDPAPYRGVIVQGGNSDPSDPESAPKGPGAAPDHPTYGAIDYGPDGKPVSHQGYLPPKDLLVQGGDTDPPKNREHQAVDALFSRIGTEHAGSATNAAVNVASKSVDLGGNLPTFRRRK